MALWIWSLDLLAKCVSRSGRSNNLMLFGIIGFASAWNACAISSSVQVLRIRDSEFIVGL